MTNTISRMTARGNVFWIAWPLFLLLSFSLSAAGIHERSGVPASSGRQLTLAETGSTLLYPLFNLWIPDYAADHPEVKITAAGTGSGTGIDMATRAAAQIGASDAYMDDAALSASPGILNIPLAVSAQQVSYNVPGINSPHLKLSGTILADIYRGSIVSWSDPVIASLNPNAALPDHPIVPVRRSDGSGDTFLFTQYLSATSASWRTGVGSGVSVKWPAVAGAVDAKGNDGMLTALKDHPYSIAYVGVSWEAETAKLAYGQAALENRDGNFVLPTPESIAEAAQAGFGSTPVDERVSLILEPGTISYPIVNYEYAIVQSRQTDKDIADALRRFLTWALDPNGGESASYLDQIHFQVLPPAIVRLSQTQIDRIGK